MNREQFQQSLEKIYPDQKVEFVNADKPIQTSHDVYFVNYELDGKTQRLVYKVYPKVRPEYKRPDLRKEVEVLQGIEASGATLVPHVFYADYSKEIYPQDYFAMTEVRGKSLSEQMGQAMTIPEKRAIMREMAELLVNIHNINLANFPSLLRSNYAITALDRIDQICTRLKKFSGKIGIEPINLMQAGLDVLKNSLPEETDSGLINGDIDMEHILKQPDGRYVVIDWDPAEIGDRCWDIYWMAKAIPHLLFGYNESLDDFISFYEDKNGRALKNKDYYEKAGLMWSYTLGMFIENAIPNHVAVPLIKHVRPIQEGKLENMVASTQK